MKHLVNIGQTDYTVLVFIADSSSTVGAGKTGLVNTNVDFSYTRVETDNDVVNTACAPASLSALTDAHTDWGFKEVSSTECPGVYRLDIADGVFASGAWSGVVSIRDAASNNVTPTQLEFQLAGVNQAVDANVVSISSDSSASDNLAEAYSKGVPFLVGQVANGVSPTTTAFETDTAAFTSKADDFFNNALVTFVSGALKGVTCRVSDFVNSTNVFTVSTLPSAPTNDDWFILIGRQTA